MNLKGVWVGASRVHPHPRFSLCYLYPSVAPITLSISSGKEDIGWSWSKSGEGLLNVDQSVESEVELFWHWQCSCTECVSVSVYVVFFFWILMRSQYSIQTNVQRTACTIHSLLHIWMNYTQINHLDGQKMNTD